MIINLIGLALQWHLLYPILEAWGRWRGRETNEDDDKNCVEEGFPLARGN